MSTNVAAPPRTSVPYLQVRQATLAPTPILTTDSAEDVQDTLSPLTAVRGLPLSASIESVVQPGRQVFEVARDIEGQLIRGKTRHQGGYADVADGTWIKPDGTRHPVAIKYLREVKMDSIKTDEVKKKQRNDIRMKREATIWEAASHPNILPLYGFRSGDDPCLVSPWCENGNLSEYLEAHKDTLTIIDKLRLLAQAGRGLAYLHSLSPPIAHGDIKPANVLVNDDIQAAFCDFGLARVLQSLESHTGLTTSNQGQGSKGFQAPELVLGQDRPATPSDVYAFGGLILSVLTGKTPFHGIKSPGRVVLAISMGKTAEPLQHPELPENDPLWVLLAKCWMFEPTARPSMIEVVEELELEIVRRQLALS